MTLTIADRTRAIQIFNHVGNLELSTKHIDAAASVSANIQTCLKYIYTKYHIDTSDFTSQSELATENTQNYQKFISRSIEELNDNYDWGITPDLISLQSKHCKTLSQALNSLGHTLPDNPSFPILAYNFKRLTDLEAKFAREMYEPFVLSPSAKKIEHKAFDCGYAYRGEHGDTQMGEIHLQTGTPIDIAALRYAEAITDAMNMRQYSVLKEQCANGSFTPIQFILASLNVDAKTVLSKMNVAMEIKYPHLNDLCDNKNNLKIMHRLDITEQEKIYLIKVEMIEPYFDFYEQQYEQFFTPNSWNVPRP